MEGTIRKCGLAGTIHMSRNTPAPAVFFFTRENWKSYRENFQFSAREVLKLPEKKSWKLPEKQKLCPRKKQQNFTWEKKTCPRKNAKLQPRKFKSTREIIFNKISSMIYFHAFSATVAGLCYGDFAPILFIIASELYYRYFGPILSAPAASLYYKEFGSIVFAFAPYI